jgi:hypothetical protein
MIECGNLSVLIISFDILVKIMKYMNTILKFKLVIEQSVGRNCTHDFFDHVLTLKIITLDKLLLHYFQI